MFRILIDILLKYMQKSETMRDKARHWAVGHEGIEALRLEG